MLHVNYRRIKLDVLSCFLSSSFFVRVLQLGLYKTVSVLISFPLLHLMNLHMFRDSVSSMEKAVFRPRTFAFNQQSGGASLDILTRARTVGGQLGA